MQRALIAVCLALAFGCRQTADPPAPTGTDAAVLLPAASSLTGWSLAEEPIEYTPDTLYEYLNGGAPRYLTFGFRRLVHVRYQLGDDPYSSIALDIYEMGGELGAFGIYSNGRSRGDGFRDWGVEGRRFGTVASAWEAAFFVHAEADDDRPDLIEMMEHLVAVVCEQIPGDHSLPSILAPLPREGLVSRSERYVATDLLGHAFLPGGVLATYDFDGHEVELFFSELGDNRSAGDALEALRTYYTRFGMIAEEPATIGADNFRLSDPGLGNGAVAVIGHHVAGVHGDAPREVQESLLTLLIDRLE